MGGGKIDSTPLQYNSTSTVSPPTMLEKLMITPESVLRYEIFLSQASFNTRNDYLKEIVAVVEKKLPEKNITLKAKVNHKLDFAISSKMPLKYGGNIATVTKGFSIKGLGSREMKMKYGVQLDLNL